MSLTLHGLGRCVQQKEAEALAKKVSQKVRRVDVVLKVHYLILCDHRAPSNLQRSPLKEESCGTAAVCVL